MDLVQKAYTLALTARENAYAPYSHFRVGAAFKLKDSDQIITGCNVENASFGATICAERGIIMKSFADYGKAEFDFAVVVTKDDPPAPPCALCLQVLAEFCGPDFPIHIADLEGIKKTLCLKELIPHSFTAFTPEE
ncbi:MAG: cytidine deaminase [Bacteriovoracaceae bacterium]|jgi:cytidine deaminase|nr:cytidine deaminase [Bacteriovoracaceae bacterium]